MSEPPVSPPPPPPGGTGSGSPGGDADAAPTKGFIARIFDLSFSEFVTPSLIKVIFVIGIILAGLMALLVFVAFANQGGGSVVVGVVLAPLIFFLYVLFARVLSELYLILFRIEENTRKN